MRADAIELARERRANHRPRVRQPHALPDSVRSARPPRVHQPALHTMPGNAIPEHFRVDAGSQREERRAETGGERFFGLGHAALGAGDLGRISRQEVIHRLLRRQFGDRRHHTEGVAGEEDDVARMTGHSLGHMIGDVMNRIGRARVFRDAL